MVKKFLRKSSKAIAIACCAAMMMSGLSGCSIGGNSNDSSSSDEADNDDDSVFGKLGNLTSGSGKNEDDGSDDSTAGDADGGADDDQLAGGPDEIDPEGGDTASYPGGLDDDGKGDDEFDPDTIPELYKCKITEYKTDDDYNIMATKKHDELVIQDYDVAANPALEKVLEKINDKANGGLSVYEMAEEAEIQFNAMEDTTYWGGYTDETSLSIERLDSKVISVKSSTYVYYGGAHGDYGDSGYNYDLTTGEEIGIYDVVTDETALLEVLTEKIQELYPDVWQYDLNYDNDAIQVVLDNEDWVNWTMQPDGITVYFNPYAIAAYAAGEQVVPIKFDEEPDLFTGDYWNSEVEDYALVGSEIRADVDGDGDLEHIVATEHYYYEEDYSYSYIDGITIWVDDKEYQLEGYGFMVDYTFIKKGSEYYLYAHTTQESDYDLTYMYKISGNEPTYLGATPGELSAGADHPFSEHDENSYTDYYGVITDINHFYFGTRTEMFGTVTGVYDAAVGNDGRIQVASGYDGLYYISGVNHEALVDKTYNTVDESGNATGTKDIKKGDEVEFYRTDNNTFADLKTSDGTIIRLDIDINEWPHTYDGVDIETLFDGIIFAG